MNRKLVRAAVGLASFSLVTAMGITSAAAADPTITFNARSGSSATANLVAGTFTVTASVPGKVEFKADGVTMKGCEAVATTATATANQAVCIWMPSKSGNTAFTATLTPTDTALAKVTSPTYTYNMGYPVNTGDSYQPVSIYVDTVTASGDKTTAFNAAINAAYTGCILTNQFIQGQRIVFRVYANDHTRGGIALTNETAEVNIKVAGVDAPIKLDYGNHSGIAFWAGVLATGKDGSGLYSKLGTINYTVNVTLLEKPAVTKEVMTTKYVKVTKNGKAIKVNGKYVYAPKQVKTTVVVTPAVKGQTYSYNPSFWATASLLTLNAAG